MNRLIQITTVELAKFLSAHLPVFGADWWKEHVEDRLSFQQQRIVREHELTTLEQLDFAALLRIIDQNWYELSQTLKLPREGRTWVKELQTVRNRWAHLSSEDIAPSEIYRDADTLGRFLDMLGAAPESIAAVEAAKTDSLSSMASALGVAVDPSDVAEGKDNLINGKSGQGGEVGSPELSKAKFSVGDLVALHSNPEVVMPVIEIMSGGVEYRYRVFQDSKKITYYESQLRHPQQSEGGTIPTGRGRIACLSDQSATTFCLNGQPLFATLGTYPVCALSIPACYEANSCGSATPAYC